MAEVLFLNGKFLPKEKAKVSVLSPGLLYGWGVFETMRAYRGGIVYLDRHLERIAHAAAITGIPLRYSQGELAKIIEKAVALSKLADCYVRLSTYKNNRSSDTVVFVKKYKPYPVNKYRLGFSACIYEAKKPAGYPLCGIKSTNHLFFKLASSLAKIKGFDESLILDSRGFISECSRANIFFIKGKMILTPGFECGCLNGITRRVVLDLAKRKRLKIKEGRYQIGDLLNSGEAFLTNSLMGIMALTRVEKNNIGNAKTGVLTKMFMGGYNYLLKNRSLK